MKAAATPAAAIAAALNARHLQRHQPHWDWRAAGNFICGGAGAGLVIFGTLCAPAQAVVPLALAGIALVGLGLFFVWLEIGRPLRAINVLLHPQTSWMSREAIAAGVLFLLGAGLLFDMPWRIGPTAVAAAVFLYCQARLLGAARGVPTWRHPLTVPLLVLTGLTEGMGLFWLLGGWSAPRPLLAVPLVALVAARWLLWRTWRQRLAAQAAPADLRALNANAPVFEWLGTLAPAALALLAFAGLAPPAINLVLLGAAGALAAFAGGLLKFTLVTRAASQQGYSLPHMPVRGVPRTAPR